MSLRMFQPLLKQILFGLRIQLSVATRHWTFQFETQQRSPLCGHPYGYRIYVMLLGRLIHVARAQTFRRVMQPV